MKKCGFDEAWIGNCKTEIQDHETACEKHVKLKCCVCGKQATHTCAHTAQFVCGFPLCDNCTGVQDHTKGYGLFGFGGHSHKRKSEINQVMYGDSDE